MLINNNKREKRKKVSFALSLGLSVFLIAPTMIAGNTFVFIGSNTIQMTSAYAQEANNASTAASTPSITTSTATNNTSSSPIQVSSQPILQERTTTTSQTPINQTHISATFTGNGTLTLPNTTETINFTTNGTALISLMTHSTQAKATIMTEQGETATATFYDILEIDPAITGNGRGLTMAIIQTDSTGMLVPLNGTIVVGISDLQSNEENTVTLWEWESGLPLPTPNGTTTTIGGAPLMNTTTTAIDAATVVETNTTSISQGEAEASAIGGLSEEQQQLSVEEQRQSVEEGQQAITTAPS